MANRINEKLDELTVALEKCEFRDAIFALRSLYAIGNEYMTEVAPWALVKEGKLDEARDVLNECFQLIDFYARVSQPFIPDTAAKMQNIFADKHDLSWPTSFERRIRDNAEFTTPENLFERIDDDKVAELVERFSNKKTIIPIVAKITEVKNHPSRDDLHVLTVDTGTEKVQVVCGAPNVHTNMIGVFAPVGAILPNNKKPLTARNVAGIKSNGMMCSAAELGIGSDSGNIIELTDSGLILGTEYKK